MNKIRVGFVKYDLTKTRNRKRKDMLVDEQTEKAVITQLERIHKGEQVLTIHELIWDEDQIANVSKKSIEDEKKLLFGNVKFFDIEKGFGFIMPDKEMEDLFFHVSTFTGDAPLEHDRVQFMLSEGPKGLCAVKVKIIDAGIEVDELDFE